MEIISETPALKYGGFWRRFVASIIDGIVLFFIQSIFNYSLTGQFWISLDISDFTNVDSATLNDYFLYTFLDILLSVVYYAGMQSSSKQATIGKMCFEMKVVKTDGTRISFLRGVGRYFSKILSALPFLIGYIMAAFDSKKQALHDKLASTMVIVEG